MAITPEIIRIINDPVMTGDNYVSLGFLCISQEKVHVINGIMTEDLAMQKLSAC